MNNKPTKEIDLDKPLYNWQEGFEQQLELATFDREPDALRAPKFPKLDKIAKKADQYKENLFKQEAIKLTLEKRIERNLHPIILVAAMCMLAASNLFFGQIPGSIGLLWITNVLFGLLVVYRLVADAEDEAVIKYRQLAKSNAV